MLTQMSARAHANADKANSFVFFPYPHLLAPNKTFSSQGPSIVSWAAINEHGETVEVKPPTPSPPSDPLPNNPEKTMAAAGGSAGGGEPDSHPRVLRLSAAHKGMDFKFRVLPVRSDGNQGHVESSRIFSF